MASTTSCPEPQNFNIDTCHYLASVVISLIIAGTIMDILGLAEAIIIAKTT
jgi:hypothetical protein